MNRLGMAFVSLLLVAATAWASQQGSLVTKNWNAMDQCSREAQAAFPDFTAEAYAKREAKEKQCLAAKNLAPHEPLAPLR